MHDPQSSSPVDGTLSALSVHHRWRFRFDLLDLLGLVTYVCVAAAMVMAAPDRWEDRLYLALTFAGAGLGIVCLHRIAAVGITCASIGAGIGGGVAMAFFRSRNGVPPSSNTLEAYYQDSPWQAVVIAIIQAMLFGFTAASLIAMLKWMIRCGPAIAFREMRGKPLRSAFMLAAIALPVGTILAVDNWLLSGGVRPTLVEDLPEVKSWGGFHVQPAAGARWVAIGEERGGSSSISPWRYDLFRVSSGGLEKCGEIYHDSKVRPVFSPNHDAIAYRAGGKFQIADLPGLSPLCELAPELAGASVLAVSWLADGKLITYEQRNEHGFEHTAYGVWSFDGRLAKRERTILASGELPMVAFAPDLSWYAEVDLVDEPEELVVRNLDDGRELARVSCDLNSEWRAFLQISGDHRFLLHDGRLFDSRLQKEVAVGLDWQRIFSGNRVVGARRPYAFVRYPETSSNYAAFDEAFLAQVPLAHSLLQLAKYQQIAIVNPATGKQECRLAASDGNIVSLSASADGGTLAAIICDEELWQDTRHRLQVWTVPSRQPK